MAGVKHSNRKHALLSASGASRWLNCTPSARLEEKFKEPPSSSFAQEGTLAHELGDLGLQKASKKITVAQYKKATVLHYESDLFTEDMPEYVQEYVDYVMEEFKAAKKRTPDALLLIEQKVDLTEYIEDGFGTNDAIIIADGKMEVIDLKYGKGIKVSADDNPQLKLYGLGALIEHELAYDITSVKLTIMQPRLQSVSSWEISAEDLLLWGEKTVRPKAKKAYAGEGIQKAGDWCKWCKAKATCATLASVNTKLAKHDFKDPHLLTDDQLLEVYKKIPLLVDWARAVSKHLLDEAKNGKQWKGYKIVEGKSNRKWSDEEKVKQALLAETYEEDEFMISKLGGIGLVEKLVGKNNFTEILGKLVVKPSGAPTLVPDSDKRPGKGVAEAKSDFKK